MTRKTRLYFYYVFAVFFLVSSPFLIIFSLGYDFNFNDRQLTNSLSISIDTRPRLTTTFNRNTEVIRGSGELKARENQVVPLSIRHQGFFDENFILWAEPNKNSTARITNLWMLPVDFERIEIRNDSDVSYQLASILSENYILLRSEDKFFIQLYGLGGIQGNPEEIDFQISRQIENPILRWEKLNDTTFWDTENELIITRRRGEWSILDTRIIPGLVSNIAVADENRLAVLDQSGSLWVWDHLTSSVRFIESGIDGIAYTNIPEFLWIWDDDTVYRLVPGRINDLISFENEVYSTRSNLDEPNRAIRSYFSVKSVFQGTMLKIGNDLFYIADLDKSQWTLIAGNVLIATTSDSSAFWLDSNFKLNTYNFFLNEFESIAGLPSLSDDTLSNVDISYYHLWRRVLVYTREEVYAVWFDKDVLNRNIIKYNPVLWITSADCIPEMRDRHQFCFRNNELVVYKNTSIW